MANYRWVVKLKVRVVKMCPFLIACVVGCQILQNFEDLYLLLIEDIELVVVGAAGSRVLENDTITVLETLFW